MTGVTYTRPLRETISIGLLGQLEVVSKPHDPPSRRGDGRGLPTSMDSMDPILGCSVDLANPLRIPTWPQYQTPKETSNAWKPKRSFLNPLEALRKQGMPTKLQLIKSCKSRMQTTKWNETFLRHLPSNHNIPYNRGLHLAPPSRNAHNICHTRSTGPRQLRVLRKAITTRILVLYNYIPYSAGLCKVPFSNPEKPFTWRSRVVESYCSCTISQLQSGSGPS